MGAITQEHLECYFILRNSWLYSKIYGHNFYKTILAKAKAGETLTVTDQQRGCPTDAHNLAKYILDLVVSENRAYGIKHFTDGEAMTWFEFAAKILNDNGISIEGVLSKASIMTNVANRPENSTLKS